MIKVPSPPFRTGSSLFPTRITLAYNAGGLGDWINWTSAIQYAIESNPHISGYVVTRPHFADLAHLWLAQYAPRFEVRVESVDSIHTLPYVQETALIIPNKEQYANTCGVNLFRLGFIYYLQSESIPSDWNHLPRIRGDEASLERFALPEDYAVITPYATADNKRLSSEAINDLSSWLLAKGITPVFLGKHDVAPDHKGTASGFDRTLGMDLTERTTLTEAACIMARSRFTAGLDNGLLHLAACSDTPLIWAFTTVEPRMIVPPRRGRTLALTPPETLECRFCQNRMRYVFSKEGLPHSFKHCVYGDNLCTAAFSGDILIKAARKVLDETDDRNSVRMP